MKSLKGTKTEKNLLEALLANPWHATNTPGLVL